MSSVPTLARASAAARIGYRGLIATAPLARSRVGAAVWERAWQQLERRGSGTARITLHGHSVVVNVGHPYPAFMRRWPTYNGPLVSVVRLAHAARHRSLTLVDVGASVGDTALLVRDRCPGMVDEIWCIEGDEVFAAMLDQNTRALEGVHPVHAMAGNGASTVPSLVRTHAGSATPRGAGAVPASTLDALTAAAQYVDVVKIDTDGYDGRVLQGASSTLAAHRPVVQFEWHPKLAQGAQVATDLPFTTLASAGYETFVWFDKFGRYTRTEVGIDCAALADLAAWCIEGPTPAPDWHYDVIALAAGEHLDHAALERSAS